MKSELPKWNIETCFLCLFENQNPDSKHSILIFGFALFKSQPQKHIFSDLRRDISSALKGALLMQTILDKEKKLELLLQDQKRKSVELETAYHNLKENQEKLLIIDKMASLGRMTAGISHEMNISLSTVRAAIMEMEKLKNEYINSIQDTSAE